MFRISDAFKNAYPDAHAGILALRHVSNPSRHTELEKKKKALEDRLRSLFSSQGRVFLENHPALRAYGAYYRLFKKTYHIRLQVESILFKGKSLPSVAALVEAMFMAELNNMLLTAGHDLDMLRFPITLTVSKGDERCILLRGEEQLMKTGDMIMTDQEGVISSVVYGPDQRTQIRPDTKNVLFAVYAPSGIGEKEILRHLNDIRQNVMTVSPLAKVEMLHVFGDNDEMSG